MSVAIPAFISLSKTRYFWFNHSVFHCENPVLHLCTKHSSRLLNTWPASEDGKTSHAGLSSELRTGGDDAPTKTTELRKNGCRPVKEVVIEGGLTMFEQNCYCLPVTKVQNAAQKPRASSAQMQPTTSSYNAPSLSGHRFPDSAGCTSRSCHLWFSGGTRWSSRSSLSSKLMLMSLSAWPSSGPLSSSSSSSSSSSLSISLELVSESDECSPCGPLSSLSSKLELCESLSSLLHKNRKPRSVTRLTQEQAYNQLGSYVLKHWGLQPTHSGTSNFM